MISYLYKMSEQGSAENLFPTYKKVPTQTGSLEGKAKTTAELREPTGEVLAKEETIEVIAPKFTNFPVKSGFQIQVAEKGLETSHLGETPLLSEKADPKAILQVASLGILAEKAIVEKTGNVWANFNFHSRPPLKREEPIEAQYNSLTLDIHGRDINDQLNWTRPPVIHGSWGVRETSLKEESQLLKETVDKKGDIEMPSTEEIEKNKSDPATRVLTANPTSSSDFEEWKDHSTGMYDWEGRREYEEDELKTLREIFSSPDFIKQVEGSKNIELFTEENPKPQVFEPNDSDMVLWEFGGYQLITQKVPLVDSQEGIHMVLKLRPEPHTPWENQRQALEAIAISIGVSRLLKNTQGLGEIGDVYLDMNANWSMTRKSKLKETMSMEDVKAEIQKDTRAHLHIQLEKMTASWELPPAPGTFKENAPQSQETIEEIRSILNKDQVGLKDWLFKNCKGKIF